MADPEITLHASRLKFAIAAIIFAFLAIVSVWVWNSSILVRQEIPVVLAILHISVVVLAEILFVVILICPRWMSLRLGANGFTLYPVLGKKFFRWDEVTPFRIKSILGLKVIAFEVRAGRKTVQRCLNDNYGMRSENLVALLNERREAAIASLSNTGGRPADGDGLDLEHAGCD